MESDAINQHVSSSPQLPGSDRMRHPWTPASTHERTRIKHTRQGVGYGCERASSLEMGARKTGVDRDSLEQKLGRTTCAFRCSLTSTCARGVSTVDPALSITSVWPPGQSASRTIRPYSYTGAPEESVDPTHRTAAPAVGTFDPDGRNSSPSRPALSTSFRTSPLSTTVCVCEGRFAWARGAFLCVSSASAYKATA